MSPARVKRSMFDPRYFSNSTNFESEGIRKLLELLYEELIELDPGCEIKRVRLVEVRLAAPSASYVPFGAQHIQSTETLRVYMPRPGEIDVPPLVALADAAREASEDSFPVAQGASKLIHFVANEFFRIGMTTGERDAHSKRLSKKITPKTELRFRQRISKAERAKNSMPSVDYQISLLEVEKIKIESKLNRQKTKLAILQKDASEEE